MGPVEQACFMIKIAPNKCMGSVIFLKVKYSLHTWPDLAVGALISFTEGGSQKKKKTHLFHDLAR